MDNYKTAKIHKDKLARAKKKGMSANEYIDHLEAQVDAGKTTEQQNILERMKALEGSNASLADALKSLRYLTDTNSLKIDKQADITAQQNEMLNKLINILGSKLAFIEALEKEITA